MATDSVKQANPADEVLPGLWLGSRYAALNPDYLKEKRITAVFNCLKDLPFEPVIRRQYRVPVDDNLQEAEIRNLELWSYEVVYKIMAEHRRATAEGGAVLVHCAAGCSGPQHLLRCILLRHGASQRTRRFSTFGQSGPLHFGLLRTLNSPYGALRSRLMRMFDRSYRVNSLGSSRTTASFL